jgi:hypothetical protein
LSERVLCIGCERNRPGQSACRDECVPSPGPVSVPTALASDCLGDAFLHHLRRLAWRISWRCWPKGHAKVEAINEGRWQASSVPQTKCFGADATRWPQSARARVRTGDQQEIGREGDGGTLAGDPDHPFFERLAQRVEDLWRKLSKFIEKEHSSVGQRDLARSRSTSASSDQCSGRRGVVWGSERAVAHQLATDRLPGGGMDPRHFKGLVILERRQDGRKGLCQQRLARTRGPDHEQVVSAGGRYLKRLAASGQAPDDGEIGDEIVVEVHTRPLRLSRGRPGLFAFECCTDLG